MHQRIAPRPSPSRAGCVMLTAVAVNLAYAEDATSAGPEDEAAKVQIVIQSRNGSAVLANVMSRLHALTATSDFRAILEAPQSSEAVDSCARDARKDPSGRTFDLANCVRVWPLEKATLEQKFERIFLASVERKGTRGFPAATVAPFESEIRLQPTQFEREVLNEQYRPRDQEVAFEVREDFKRSLCNPKITFISVDSCMQNVRVVSRLGVYQPDIYVPQTGYRVDVTRPMRPEVAVKLRRAILRDLNVPDKAPGALRVVILKKEKAKSEQGAPSERQDADSGAEITAVWSAVGTKPERIDFTTSRDTPPTLLVFDSPDLSAPMSIADWLAKLKFAGKAQADCSPDAGHSDAATGVLFPSTLLGKLKGSGPPASLAAGWSGFILSARHFKGAAVVNDAPWFRRKIFPSPDEPIVALTVFSTRYEVEDEGAATNAANSYLSDPSNLLVVATAQKSKVPQAHSFRPDAGRPPQDAGDVEDFCSNKAWPACLGRHPRVVVVGPSEYPDSSGAASVFKPADFHMGASTVRMLAPGGNVPVIARCATGANSERSWRIATSSGTSFAAPMVAAVTAKLLQIGPPQMRAALPEAAFWRILATSSALSVPQGAESNPFAQFGRLDAGKAIVGATMQEIGSDNAATLYEMGDQGSELVGPAVVMPFPWMDQPMLVESTGIGPQMQVLRRGVITLTTVKGMATQLEALEFDRLLRIVRRPSEEHAGAPLFDVYYLDGINLKYVAVKRRVRLGNGAGIEQPGFCRNNGLTVPADGTGRPQGQAQPSCLYAWRQGAKGFTPLDMSRVRDIVFPPLHFGSRFVAGMDPTDVRAMTGNDSPWREQVCNTGPRAGAQKVLNSLNQPKVAVACSR